MSQPKVRGARVRDSLDRAVQFRFGTFPSSSYIARTQRRHGPRPGSSTSSARLGGAVASSRPSRESAVHHDRAGLAIAVGQARVGERICRILH